MECTSPGWSQNESFRTKMKVSLPLYGKRFKLDFWNMNWESIGYFKLAVQIFYLWVYDKATPKSIPSWLKNDSGLISLCGFGQVFHSKKFRLNFCVRFYTSMFNQHIKLNHYLGIQTFILLQICKYVSALIEIYWAIELWIKSSFSLILCIPKQTHVQI